MTIEKAIKYLEVWRECYRNSIDSCTAQAIGMAIEALENEADRKTENSSEKPNNSKERLQACIDCEHTDMCEWCYTRWSKDEPTTQTETQNSNLTFEKRTMRDCYNCKRYETEDECIECKFEPKDEPQTERSE